MTLAVIKKSVSPRVFWLTGSRRGTITNRSVSVYRGLNGAIRGCPDPMTEPTGRHVDLGLACIPENSIFIVIATMAQNSYK